MYCLERPFMRHPVPHWRAATEFLDNQIGLGGVRCRARRRLQDRGFLGLMIENRGAIGGGGHEKQREITAFRRPRLTGLAETPRDDEGPLVITRQIPLVGRQKLPRRPGQHVVEAASGGLGGGLDLQFRVRTVYPGQKVPALPKRGQHLHADVAQQFRLPRDHRLAIAIGPIAQVFGGDGERA